MGIVIMGHLKSKLLSKSPTTYFRLPGLSTKVPSLFPELSKTFSGAGRRRRRSLKKKRMDAPMIIEQEIGGLNNDALRFGLHGVKSDIVASHPLESSYQSVRVREEQVNRKVLADLYGSAFPLKMELDRKILSRVQRPPGMIPSSMLGLEAITGALEDFSVKDYLSDVHDTETYRVPDMHHGMEVRLGLSKGPIAPTFM